MLAESYLVEIPDGAENWTELLANFEWTDERDEKEVPLPIAHLSNKKLEQLLASAPLLPASSTISPTTARASLRLLNAICAQRYSFTMPFRAADFVRLMLAEPEPRIQSLKFGVKILQIPDAKKSPQMPNFCTECLGHFRPLDQLPAATGEEAKRQFLLAELGFLRALLTHVPSLLSELAPLIVQLLPEFFVQARNYLSPAANDNSHQQQQHQQLVAADPFPGRLQHVLGCLCQEINKQQKHFAPQLLAQFVNLVAGQQFLMPAAQQQHSFSQRLADAREKVLLGQERSTTSSAIDLDRKRHKTAAATAESMFTLKANDKWMLAAAGPSRQEHLQQSSADDDDDHHHQRQQQNQKRKINTAAGGSNDGRRSASSTTSWPDAGAGGGAAHQRQQQPLVIQQRRNIDYYECFADRHIGPSTSKNLQLDNLTNTNVPAADGSSNNHQQLKRRRPNEQPPPAAADTTDLEEWQQKLIELRAITGRDRTYRTFIGMGYYDCIVPLPNIEKMLHNAGWNSPYTPSHVEVARDRLVGLFRFQTMVADLTGLQFANASLPDESTACAEAISMALRTTKRNTVLYDSQMHTPNNAVMQTLPLGIQSRPINLMRRAETIEPELTSPGVATLIVQHPNAEGRVYDHLDRLIQQAHKHEVLVILVCDLLSLTLLRSPGDLGADICVGSAQRFGHPRDFGGSHTAFMTVNSQQLFRQMPGHHVDVSTDQHGDNVYRLTMQTREQHIRRDKSTSNICTAQALSANISAMYAVYHGPQRLVQIAKTIHKSAAFLAKKLKKKELGVKVVHNCFFDTLKVRPRDMTDFLMRCAERQITVRIFDDIFVGISIDETTLVNDLCDLLHLFEIEVNKEEVEAALLETPAPLIGSNSPHARRSAFLSHAVFNSYHSETQLISAQPAQQPAEPVERRNRPKSKSKRKRKKYQKHNGGGGPTVPAAATTTEDLGQFQRQQQRPSTNTASAATTTASRRDQQESVRGGNGYTRSGGTNRTRSHTPPRPHHHQHRRENNERKRI